MRNTAERIKRLHERARQLRLRKDRRIAAVSGAVCLMLFAGLLYIIRQSFGTITDTAGNYYTGSSLLSSEAGGYVLIAVIAFMLGAAAVVLLRKYAGPKDRDTQRDREEQD
ncbi:MAG: hypothetical protein J5643_01740 [Lachnospiraceae bacterium]|nr:hypothetical protein [Lachnospiraceae bacterium]